MSKTLEDLQVPGRVLVRMKFGSHLYGTNTDTSDTDYKGVYLPTIEDCILGNVKKSIQFNSKSRSSTQKNTKDDFDCEFYSLQNFVLKLGINGDSTFLDMIHAPDNMLLETSKEWEFLRKNRSKFYTKSLKSYLGYAKRHSLAFTNSSAKLEAVETLLAYLNIYSDDTKLALLYNNLPTSSFSRKYEIQDSESHDKRTYEFCGRKFMATTNIRYIKESLSNIQKEYGQRTKDAKENGGVNLKSLSHAFRIAYQLKQLYSEGDLTFPLKQSQWFRDLKKGKIDVSNKSIYEDLNTLLVEVDELASKSDYPEEVEAARWQEWLVNLY